MQGVSWCAESRRLLDRRNRGCSKPHLGTMPRLHGTASMHASAATQVLKGEARTGLLTVPRPTSMLKGPSPSPNCMLPAQSNSIKKAKYMYGEHIKVHHHHFYHHFSSRSTLALLAVLQPACKEVKCPQRHKPSSGAFGSAPILVTTADLQGLPNRWRCGVCQAACRCPAYSAS